MDSIGAISGMKNAELGMKISMAVMRKGLDAAEQQGAAVVSLLEDAAALSNQLNHAPARADGSPLGMRVDVRA